MVGVAGRTKACAACYRRHIKCDEAQPSCMRCQKANIPCPGPQADPFISFEAGQKGLRRLWNGKRAAEQRTPTKSVFLARNGLDFVSWPQDESCISYARASLPQVWCDVPEGSISGEMNASHGITDNLVQYTLVALARTLFGYRSGEQPLLNRGLALYGQVLSALQKALMQPDLVERTGTLEAVILLRYFDSFVPSHVDAWVQHSLGVEKLLQVRGPESHQAPIPRKLLERARPLVIMACLRQQTSTILADEEWLSIPWAGEVGSKSQTELLVDIFAGLPAALYGQSTDRRQRRPPPAECADIRARASALLRRLQTWRAGWVEQVQRQNPDNGQHVLRHTSSLPSSFPCLGSFYAGHATELALHSAVCLITIDKAFGQELDALCCTQCIQQPSFPQTTGHRYPHIRSTTTIKSTDIVEMYHSALAEACTLVGYYGPSPSLDADAVKTLIYLRQVWVATRRLKCSMAVWFNDAMKSVMTNSSAQLPLFLYQ
ncbi:hypothetical protein PV11_01632 [Exophiala sideris]|uniref:Zn(2)-C6 fungal-type domain-containing protein n=1 Tax=Exophiala sideris TaxID=1016849 RepID=A0A0D1YTR4_9EURO|nr:hypothetical protein PV11_01632 [Exophiala sideris]